ncbi:MAG: hypothetical protein AB7U20_18310 [Planctomycetaceae bacterium]
MKPSHFSLIVALFVFSGGGGLTESPVQAQSKTGVFSTSFQVPYYLIQVEYAFPKYGYYGGYGGRRYSYAWLTIAETSDLAEAEFIYDLYELAWQLGVLDEVAPNYGYKSFPTRVRMITEYRTIDPAYTANVK